MGGIAVGCAGWSIPGQYRDLFGEGESMLARYATRFAVAEINSSFHRPHRPDTYARWAATVPAAFRFSVKLPNLVSHELALRGTGPALDRVLDESQALGRKLGGYLLQLPPRQAFDARRMSSFLRVFRRRSDAPLVCEPRHASWFTNAAAQLLDDHDVSRLGADPARVTEAAQPAPHSSWPYWRWHGSPRMYYSSYSDAELQALAATLAARSRRAPRAWVIFDNTAHGFSIPNALALQALLAGPSQERPHA